jgi:RAB6A-GEF complex partner protein 1
VDTSGRTYPYSPSGKDTDVLGTGDPSEDAAVATVVFLLDGKLVLLRPSTRTEVPATDLKYDMRVLSDKIEFFLLLVGRGDDSPMPALKGSIWAWDGKYFKVSLLSYCTDCRSGFPHNAEILLEMSQL